PFWYRHNEALLSFGLSSTPYVGGPSWTTATPSGSSALRKNALLAAYSLTPNLTWSNMSSPELCGPARGLTQCRSQIAAYWNPLEQIAFPRQLQWPELAANS